MYVIIPNHKINADDMAVHSDQWEEHLIHLARFLKTIRDAKFTLNLKKCRWAQSRVKFCGKIMGSGQRFADTEKVKSFTK